MPNKCYIYAVKGDLSRTRDFKIIAIGEHQNSIPLSYKILSAYDNSVYKSFITDSKTAIVADYRRGKNSLLWLLDYLYNYSDFKLNSAFLNQVKDTKKTFNELDADLILLESEDIYQLNKDISDADLLNEQCAEDYRKIGETIEKLKEDKFTWYEKFIQKQVKTARLLIEAIKSDWQDGLGIDSWSNIIWFNLNCNKRRIKYFIDIIKKYDFNAVESARDIITSDEVDIMIDKYWEMDSWIEKGEVIHLIEDKLGENAKYLMMDFLMNAPSDLQKNDFTYDKALILTYLENNFTYSKDLFNYYSDNPNRMYEKIKEIIKYTSDIVFYKEAGLFIIIAGITEALLIIAGDESLRNTGFFLFFLSYIVFLFLCTSERSRIQRYKSYKTIINGLPN